MSRAQTPVSRAQAAQRHVARPRGEVAVDERGAGVTARWRTRSGARVAASLYRCRGRLRVDHVRRVELHDGRREPTVSLDDRAVVGDLPRAVVSTLRRHGFRVGGEPA